MKFFLLLPLLSALCILWISHSSCSASMVSSTAGSAVQFDYTLHGPHGPLHWGDLRPDWETCKAGKQQSPVHIKNVERHPLPSYKLQGLRIRYAISRQETSAGIQRAEHMSPTVLWKHGGGILEINGTAYYLLQWHWHHPSEHKLFGRRYPLEMHMVHRSLDNKIAVVAVLYQYGKQNQFIAEITSQLQWMLRNNETHLDVKQLKADHSSLGRHYYRYEGSLSTPPCTEGVIWTVIKKRWEVRREQIQALMDATLVGRISMTLPRVSVLGCCLPLSQKLTTHFGFGCRETMHGLFKSSTEGPSSTIKHLPGHPSLLLSGLFSC